MSRASDQAFLAKLERKVGQLAPEMRRRILAAFEIIKRSLPQAEMVEALRDGSVERLILEVLDDGFLDPRLQPLKLQIDRLVMRASALEAAELPGKLGIGFGVLSPEVLVAANNLSISTLLDIKTELRGAVMLHIKEGLKAGSGPLKIARGIRDVVGLGPSQLQIIQNFEAKLRLVGAPLRAGASPSVLTYKLRDHRFDRTIRRLAASGKSLTEKQVQTMTAAYKRRMIAHNANTIARTLTLETLKTGQRLAWVDAVNRGVTDPNDLRREWLAVGGPVGDGRNRPEHLAMHGEVVGFNQPFSNGQIVPGSSDWNCRCRARTFVYVPSRVAATV